MVEAKTQYVGKRIPRVDALDKVTGNAVIQRHIVHPSSSIWGHIHCHHFFLLNFTNKEYFVIGYLSSCHNNTWIMLEN